MKNIAIIGAGAAGLMTAATILESTSGEDFHIYIFEKNTSPGKKVIISGGGRCNVTTTITDKKILETKYVRGWDAIRKSLGKFSPKKCYEWFELHGVPLKTEGERVFPVSDDGSDIVGVFESIFAKYRDSISMHYGEGVNTVNRYGERFSLTTPKGVYSSDFLVITTGGNAYAHTGSSGDGYAFARALGHTITPLGPSLSSFLIEDDWIKELSGMSFEEASISFSPPSGVRGASSLDRNDKKEQKILHGPLLFTHFGISGPVAFMLSSHLAWESIAGKPVLFAPIANMKKGEWDQFLRESFACHPKKNLINILTEKISRRFAEAFVVEFFSSLQMVFVGGISRKDREYIAELLGNGITLTLIDRRPGDEFVTAGGVNMDEIDHETMESKLQKNLYFAGEILNVDGYTGGFSLQLCWASGYNAGRAISKKI